MGGSRLIIWLEIEMLVGSGRRAVGFEMVVGEDD